MNRIQNIQKAFTLIELLIVVAIIAILAAIAVPNFLEAQVRAKVSRAAADLRTVQLGLESYRLDNNNYPYAQDIDSAVWVVPGGYPVSVTPGDGPGGITTPIAYVSSVPIDAFEHSFSDGSGNILIGKGPLYYDRAGFGYDENGRLPVKPTFVPADAVGNGSIIGTGADVLVSDPAFTPRAYVLYSLGPDLDLVVKQPDNTLVSRSKYHLDNRYDSTNGTISIGNIIRYASSETFP